MLLGSGQRWMLNRPLSAARIGAAERPRIVRIPRPCNDNGQARDPALVWKVAVTFSAIAVLLTLAIWRSQVFL